MLLLHSLLLVCFILNLNYATDVTSERDGENIADMSTTDVSATEPESTEVESRAFHSSSVSSFSCLTPDGQFGSCIPIKQCKYLYDLLKFNISQPGVIGLLRNSRCGLRNSVTRDVCCPTTTSAKTSISPDPGLSVPKSSLPSNTLQCGNRSVTALKIVGGRESELGTWPWMAAIYCSGSKQGRVAFQCGGSLISDQWVLTASHCLKCADKSSTLTHVRLGDLDLNGTVEDKATPVNIAIKQILQHPKYTNSPFQNDIALIRLNRPVKYTKYIYPICLLSGQEYVHDEYYNKKRPYVAGWGSTEYGTPSSSRLMEANIPTVSLSQCEKNYWNHKTQAVIDKRIICAGDGTHDSCSGDSGGPLMFVKSVSSNKRAFFQGGIVSFGVRCAEKDFPGVYTKVAAFIDWINESTGLNF